MEIFIRHATLAKASKTATFVHSICYMDYGYRTADVTSILRRYWPVSLFLQVIFNLLYLPNWVTGFIACIFNVFFSTCVQFAWLYVTVSGI